MIRSFAATLLIVVFASIAARADAAIGHRFWIANDTDFCMTSTVQMKGPYAAQALPDLRSHVTAHDTVVWFKGTTKEFFIEYTLHDCTTKKIVYKGWYIAQSEGPLTKMVERPQGTGFTATAH